ncbi:hypothetical protein Bbelb_104330 [Branchiostoma belcheri]|nr:hypothetical protein Bbelb_104330 [Branchiostoma belcheri]
MPRRRLPETICCIEDLTEFDRLFLKTDKIQILIICVNSGLSLTLGSEGSDISVSIIPAVPYRASRGFSSAEMEEKVKDARAQDGNQGPLAVRSGESRPSNKQAPGRSGTS